MNAVTGKSVMLQRFQETIRARKGLVGCGNDFTVALHIGGRLLYSGTNRRGQASDTALKDILSVHAAADSVVALREDGTVYAVGRSPSETLFASGLACVRRVESTAEYIAALSGEGTLLMDGDVSDIYRTAAEWSSLTDMACGTDFIAGLCADGRVLLAGGSRRMQRLVGEWTDIAGIFADARGEALYAITAGGKLLATIGLPFRTRDWRNLVFVSAYGHRLAAVTASGQMLTTFKNSAALKRKTVVTCAVGAKHAVAVTKDGEVEAWGDDRFGQCKTARFDRLFDRFEEMSTHRHHCFSEMKRAEGSYQAHYDEAARFDDLLSCGRRLTACVTANGRVLTSSAVISGKTWTNIRAIACGNAHVLALTWDGRALADGNSVGDGDRDCCQVTEWHNIRAITAGSYHSLGVTYDGHVCFCGDNQHGQGDVSAWTDIRLVRTTDTYTVGVTHGGDLCIAGLPPFDPLLSESVQGRVADVRATSTHILCRLSDGRAFATLPPDPSTGRTDIDADVSAWHHVLTIAASRGISAALCRGGLVRVSGGNAAIRREIAAWRDIVSIGCGETYVVGLDVRGCLHIAGAPVPERKCHTDRIYAHTTAAAPVQISFADAARWQDIIAFACGPSHMIALDREGQVFACGSDSDGQCSVTTHFTLFRDVGEHIYIK